MAEHTAPAAKPKKALPKSRQMMNEQTAKCYADAWAAKKRGEPVGWSTAIFPRRSARHLAYRSCTRRTTAPPCPLSTWGTSSSPTRRESWAIPSISALCPFEPGDRGYLRRSQL